MKPHLLLCLLSLAIRQVAQVSFGVNPGIGIGFNAPDSFSPKPKVHVCSGGDSIRYSVVLLDHSLYFKKSSDQGLTWNDSSLVFSIPSATSTMVNNRRVNTEPRIACDLSGGEYHQRVYIVWSDLKSGKKNLDVFLVYSDDEGRHWTEPVLISYRPNHKHQFMPDLLVDPKNGTVYVLYADQQNFTNEIHCDIQLACSKNGGLKFETCFINPEVLKLSASVQPKLLLTEAGVEGSWKVNSPGILLNPSAPAVTERGRPLVNIQNKTFSYNTSVEIPFELTYDCRLSAVLSKPLDSGFEKILFIRKKHKKGKNSLALGAYLLNLPVDTYVLTLYDEHSNSYVWITPD